MVKTKLNSKSSAQKQNKKQHMLAKRIGMAFAMLPLVIAALWFGYPYVDILVLLVGVLLSWEWSNMVPSRKPAVYLSAYAFALAVSVFIYSTHAIVLTIIFTTIFVFLKSRKEAERFLLTLGVPYISIGVGSLAWIYHGFAYAPYNFYMTLWFLLMVWAMDVGAYIVGSNLKGPKLAPSISPNKTWSGLFGGLILAIAVSELYFHGLAGLKLVRIDANSELFFAMIGGLIALISQAGDLVESAMKRHLKIKDSSDLIPGHGGIFDRIDALIFTAPLVYWLFAYGLLYF
ncbi:MAG: phosphatidate cytidylyltransferase [Alphaproteobacteria bacterium]|nr:phosphatidate cytidylyltransferase [Alphaproteobacteria bacterium]